MTNGPVPELPPTSQYRSVEAKIVGRAKGDDLKGRMTSEEYADKVVGDVLSGANGLIHRGKLASAGRLLTHLPTFLAVSQVSFILRAVANIYDRITLCCKVLGWIAGKRVPSLARHECGG